MEGSEKNFIEGRKGRHNKEALGKTIWVHSITGARKIIFSFVIFTGLLNYSASNKCRQPHTYESATFLNCFILLPSFFKLSKF